MLCVSIHSRIMSSFSAFIYHTFPRVHNHLSRLRSFMLYEIYVYILHQKEIFSHSARGQSQIITRLCSAKHLNYGTSWVKCILIHKILFQSTVYHICYLTAYKNVTLMRFSHSNLTKSDFFCLSSGFMYLHILCRLVTTFCWYCNWWH